MINWNARNFYQGPGAWNEDISIYKDFKFQERYKLRFTGDFFNAFNHPNNVLPNTTDGPSGPEPAVERSANHSVLREDSSFSSSLTWAARSIRIGPPPLLSSPP